ncbi:MAG: 2-hydroxyacid dehydrogenase [Bacteroidia bacterium]
MKVALFSAQPYDIDYFKKINTKHFINYYETRLDINTVNLAKNYTCVCVFVNDKLNEQVINELANVGTQLIALRCAGFNNVDVEAAKKFNIKVVRVPAYSPQAVAEHAVALILTLNRKTHKAYNRVREQNFSLDKLIGFDLYKKTVGIVGTGNIGKAFAKIMLGFGCNVIAFDPNPDNELKLIGVSYFDLNHILKYSDIISLHCPLNNHTHHLINTKTLNLMKDGVMLINTSRGGLINTKDAIVALKNQKLGYLGIDVYEQEEHLFFKDLSESIISDDLIARLMSFPNVIVTSHQGFFTHEAMTEIAETTLQNITDFETGKTLTNEVL